MVIFLVDLPTQTVIFQFAMLKDQRVSIGWFKGNNTRKSHDLHGKIWLVSVWDFPMKRQPMSTQPESRCSATSKTHQESEGPRPHVALGALWRLHGPRALAAHELGSQEGWVVVERWVTRENGWNSWENHGKTWKMIGKWWANHEIIGNITGKCVNLDENDVGTMWEIDGNIERRIHGSLIALFLDGPRCFGKEPPLWNRMVIGKIIPKLA